MAIGETYIADHGPQIVDSSKTYTDDGEPMRGFRSSLPVRIDSAPEKDYDAVRLGDLTRLQDIVAKRVYIGDDKAVWFERDEAGNLYLRRLTGDVEETLQTWGIA